jgi:hypothetical protein
MFTMLQNLMLQNLTFIKKYRKIIERKDNVVWECFRFLAKNNFQKELTI